MQKSMLYAQMRRRSGAEAHWREQHVVAPVDRGIGADQLDSLVAVLDLVRFQTARTRPELVRRSGLGRTVVTQRLAQLTSSGLVAEGALGPSTGGRAPRELRFRAEAAV